MGHSMEEFSLERAQLIDLLRLRVDITTRTPSTVFQQREAAVVSERESEIANQWSAGNNVAHIGRGCVLSNHPHRPRRRDKTQ
jgi:hypothetical protein